MEKGTHPVAASFERRDVGYLVTLYQLLFFVSELGLGCSVKITVF
jgi:hypothetical protein